MTGMLTGCGSDTTKITEGMQLVETLDYQGALNAFDEAEAQKEDSRLIARGRGIASMGLTEYDQAVEYFTQALELSDGWVQNVDYDMNYYLAAAYTKNGQPAEAKKVYDAILGLKPEEKDAYFLRGSAELELGDYESAKADFDQAISMDPKNYDRLIEMKPWQRTATVRSVRNICKMYWTQPNSWMLMTADGSIIIWENTRKLIWRWMKPGIREARTAISIWEEPMRLPEIITMRPVCTTIISPSRGRMQKSTMNLVCAKWQKRSIRMLWRHFRRENRSKETA